MAKYATAMSKSHMSILAPGQSRALLPESNP
jgi:hypothetical protein